MPKVGIIAKREYLKNVRKLSFWLATLMFPLFLVTLSLVSSLSGKAVEDKIKKDAQSAKLILVKDDAKVINPVLVQKPLALISSQEDALNKVKNGEADAFIFIPTDIVSSSKVQVFAQSKGILSKNRYNELATNLIKQSILSEVNDPEKIKLFNSNINVAVTSYKNGMTVDESYEKLVVPFVGVVIYFILVTFANSFLLFSVSEEKENRMIEVVLTSVRPVTLILGKIIGQIATVLTQLATLVLLGGVGVYFARPNIPINLSVVHVSALTVLMGIFYILMGLLIIGNTMVAVGAAMPTYKEAQSFSSVFIIASILPVYFFSIILADPSGTVAKIVSYFPFTAPMILLFRYTLGELKPLELILTSILVMLYAVITFLIAVKLFEFGSLEYNKRISFKNLLAR